jgi:hypothetical protein
MNMAISLALIPLYLLIVGLIARFILRKLPDGRLKRLLSRRIGPH